MEKIKWKDYRIFKWPMLILPIIFALIAIISFIVGLNEPTDCGWESCVSISRIFFGLFSWLLVIYFVPYVVYIFIRFLLKRKK